MNSQEERIRKERKINVFLSSTFKNMEEERDLLASKIFLELESAATRRNVVLNLLDLRWGITSEESEHGKVAEICLKEIDNSRPFFIGILGDRYGWIPTDAEIDKNDDFIKTYPWFKDAIDKRLSITEIEIQYGVLKSTKPINALFYFKLGSDEKTPDISDEEYKKLIRLKEEIRSQDRFPLKYYGNAEDLGELIKEDVLRLLDIYFPVKEVDLFERMENAQEGIIRKYNEQYTEIDACKKALDDFVFSPYKLLVVKGESGSGKSSLLANWVKKSHFDDIDIYWHFIDDSEQGSDYTFFLQCIYRHICLLWDVDPYYGNTPSTHEEFVMKLYELFNAHKEKKVIIVIDALEQLNSMFESYQLRWLPLHADNVKIICSTNGENEEINLSLELKHPRLFILPALADKSIIAKVANDYLRPFRKSLLSSQVEMITRNRLFSNPLLLITLLEELRLFGRYEHLDEKIKELTTCKTEKDFFDRSLERIERNFSYNNRDIAGFVFTLLAITRDGVTQSDISRMLDIPMVYVSRFLDVCHKHILDFGGHYKLSHQRFKKAVLLRYDYLKDEIVHEYASFLRNKCEELKESKGRPYSNTLFELLRLLYDFEQWGELHYYCCQKEVFYFFDYSSPTANFNYWCALLEHGYSIMPLLENKDVNEQINELENKEHYALFQALRMCNTFHATSEVEKIVKYGTSYFSMFRHISIEREFFYWEQYLKMCFHRNDDKKGIQIADYIISEAGSNKERIGFKAIALEQKSHFVEESNFSESIMYLMEAKEIFKRTNNREHFIVCCINLGRLYAKSGRYQKANKEYMEAYLEVQKHVEYEPTLLIHKLNCEYNLAALFERAKNSAQSLHFKDKACSTYEKLKHSPHAYLIPPSVSFQMENELKGTTIDNLEEDDSDEIYTQSLQRIDESRESLSESQYVEAKYSIMSEHVSTLVKRGEYEVAEEQLSMLINEVRYYYERTPNTYISTFTSLLAKEIDLYQIMGKWEHTHKLYINYLSIICDETTREKLGKVYLYAVMLKQYAFFLMKMGDMDGCLDQMKTCLKEYVRLCIAGNDCIDEVAMTVVYIGYIEYEHAIVTNDNLSEALIALYKKHKYIQNRGFLKKITRPFFSIQSQNDTNENLLVACICWLMLKTDNNNSDVPQCLPYADQIMEILVENRDISCREWFMKNLAIWYSETSLRLRDVLRISDAIICCDNAIKLLSEITGVSVFEELAVSYHVQACNYYIIGHTSDAISLYNQAMLLAADNGIKKYLPTILIDYAVAQGINSLESSLDKLNKAITILKDTQNMSELARAYETMANIKDMQQEFDDAERLYRTAMYILQNDDSEASKLQLGKTQNNYGIILANQGRSNEAWKLFVDSRQTRLGLGKIKRHEVVNTLTNLVAMSFNMNLMKDLYHFTKEIIEIDESFDIIACNLLKEYEKNIELFCQASTSIGRENEAKMAFKKFFNVAVKKLGNSEDLMRKRANELFRDTSFLM